MDTGSRDQHTNRPALAFDWHWWGRRCVPTVSPSVIDLVNDGLMPPAIAGFLVAALERRIPLTVISSDAGAGKTALLTALLAQLPAWVSPVIIRGSYEPFDFIWDPVLAPPETALLINEISPHWPFYLWGPAAAKTLRLTRRGYAVYATAHAGSATEFVNLLANAPHHVPLRDIASLGIVVTLNAPAPAGGRANGATCVSKCTGLAIASDGQHIAGFTLARSRGDVGAADLDPVGIAAWQARYQRGESLQTDCCLARPVELSKRVE